MDGFSEPYLTLGVLFGIVIFAIYKKIMSIKGREESCQIIQNLKGMVCIVDDLNLAGMRLGTLRA